jgi:hypothetical protein
MITREEARRLFRLALETFAPGWEIVADLTEVTLREPQHWLSGIGTFGATVRDRATGAVKVLGRRHGPEPNATFHRGISRLVIEAYGEGTHDPIHRYLHEIGVAAVEPLPRGGSETAPTGAARTRVRR